MSQQLINRSSDLNKLRNQGYNLEILPGFLLVHDIPYVNSQKQIKCGILIMPLNLAGDITSNPPDHVCHFFGEYPCDANGQKLIKIGNEGREQKLAEGVIINHTFSAKPKPRNSYSDYYEKVTTYTNIISIHAQRIDEKVTAKTFPVIAPNDNFYPFNYYDTASSRVGIANISKKLELDSVAIIGLGGTGSYILDLIAKTPVKEIHLYDGDEFLNHNAFRAPGAPTIDELRLKPLKVNYFKSIYSKMHRGIVEHPYHVNEKTILELSEKSFVFISIHASTLKSVIINKLNELNISYIDVGLGLDLGGDKIGGTLRVTTSTKDNRDHVNGRISTGVMAEDNDYSSNIQIADLNALNATLAVIKWKKLCGFYRDYKNEHNCSYTIDTNQLLSENIKNEKEYYTEVPIC